MTQAEFNDRLEIFYSGVSPHRATIFARLRDQPSGGELTLYGFVRGPHCLYSTTLPATIQGKDAGPGESLLMKAMIPDPCYWSPELPFLYDVHVELRRGDEVIASIDRPVGLRNFGPRGKYFYLDAKRWTVRGAVAASASTDLLAWRDAPLSLLCLAPPTNELCEEASRIGVMLIVKLDHDPRAAATDLRRLARHAAVAIVALAHEQLDPLLKAAGPNVVFARQQELHGEQPSAEGFDCLLAMLVDPGDALATKTLDLPVICARPEQHSAPSAAREGCDELQARLAPIADFAGYIV